jgi:uncharacterized protein
VALGCLNLTHRDSHEHATLLEPGRVYDTVVELDDIAHAFPAGHRIAVALSTTYWPICWPSPELATLTVSLGESWLELPVRPPRSEDADLRPFDLPESGPETPVIHHPAPDPTPRRVTRDLLSGRMQVDFPRWTYRTELVDIGQTMTSSGYARFHVVDGDPLSAVSECGYEVTIARKDAVVGHHSTGSLACDATHFIVKTALRVTENGETIFAREWDERIPRDMV